jgi:hypothetical protein
VEAVSGSMQSQEPKPLIDYLQDRMLLLHTYMWCSMRDLDLDKQWTTQSR